MRCKNRAMALVTNTAMARKNRSPLSPCTSIPRKVKWLTIAPPVAAIAKIAPAHTKRGVSNSTAAINSMIPDPMRARDLDGTDRRKRNVGVDERPKLREDVNRLRRCRELEEERLQQDDRCDNSASPTEDDDDDRWSSSADRSDLETRASGGNFRIFDLRIRVK